MLLLAALSAALLPVPAVSQSGDASRLGSGDVDKLASKLILALTKDLKEDSKVALLPLARRVGLPEEAHRRFYDALAGALSRTAVGTKIKMVSGPRQRQIYRHRVSTFDKDEDTELDDILQKAEADFVVICLWKDDDPVGFELSCAPSGVQTIVLKEGGVIRFLWESKAEYLEFVVAHLVRSVLGNRDVDGVREVRMHDRRFGGRTELTDFVTGLLQQESMEVAGERGSPGASGRTGWEHRLEGEVWHPDDERLRLWIRLYEREAPDGEERFVSGDDVYMAVSSLPSNLHPLEMSLVDETWWAARRATVRVWPGGHEKAGTLAAGEEAYVTGRVTDRRGREWLRVDLDDERTGFVLASSLSETRSGGSHGAGRDAARATAESPRSSASGEDGTVRPSPGAEVPAAGAPESAPSAIVRVGGLRLSDWLLLAEDGLQEGDHRKLLVEGAEYVRAHGAHAAVGAVLERALAGLLKGLEVADEESARETLATVEQIRGVVGKRAELSRLEAEAHVRLGQHPEAVAAFRSWLDLAPADHSDRKRMLLALQRAERGELEPSGGEVLRACDETWCPELVVVPAGSYMMGTSPGTEEGRGDDEGPIHEVIIAKRFAAGVHEVTFEEWDACRRGGGCRHDPDDEGWGGGKQPVINVSWEDAQEYVRWLSRETGKKYRLLSESEWEYVARAGTEGPFHFGSTISTEQANYNGNYTYGSGRKGEHREKTVPVGSFSANGFGLKNVHGNVWEWVEDCWHDSYEGAPSDGSAWTVGGDCSRRVLRGGSWVGVPLGLRSASRVRLAAGFRDNDVGFRVARTLD